MEQLLNTWAESAEAAAADADDLSYVRLMVRIARGDRETESGTRPYALTPGNVREWGAEVTRLLREAAHMRTDWVWFLDHEGDPIGFRASDLVSWVILHDKAQDAPDSRSEFAAGAGEGR